MAIGHLHVGVISRGSGKSSVDSVAYATRSRILDERTGQVYDYTRNAGDIVASWVFLPVKARGIEMTAGELANAMETRETRINSRTARTLEISLPHEFTDKQREYIAKDYVREQFTRKGIAATVAIHKPHDWGDNRNYHMHIVVATRYMDEKGLGAKDRDSNTIEALQGWRDAWENLANRKLAQYGHEARISMKTLEAQGIDRTPQIHMGPVAAALERKGIETDRGAQVREVANDNQAEVQKGRAWTEGRARVATVQAVEVVTESAVDRQKREDQEQRAATIKQAEADDRRMAYRVAPEQRSFASAIWALARSAGASLAHVFGVNLASELKQGRRVELIQANDNGELSREQIAAQRARDALAAELRGELVQEPEAPPVRRRPERKPEPEPRVFVDRGRAPAPYRAMIRELRDNELDQSQPSSTTWEQLASIDKPAPKRETLLARLEREAAERGEVLGAKIQSAPEIRLERKLKIKRPRQPGDPDEPD